MGHSRPLRNRGLAAAGVAGPRLPPTAGRLPRPRMPPASASSWATLRGSARRAALLRKIRRKSIAENTLTSVFERLRHPIRRGLSSPLRPSPRPGAPGRTRGRLPGSACSPGGPTASRSLSRLWRRGTLAPSPACRSGVRCEPAIGSTSLTCPRRGARHGRDGRRRGAKARTAVNPPSPAGRARERSLLVGLGRRNRTGHRDLTSTPLKADGVRRPGMSPTSPWPGPSATIRERGRTRGLSQLLPSTLPPGLSPVSSDRGFLRGSRPAPSPPCRPGRRTDCRASRPVAGRLPEFQPPEARDTIRSGRPPSPQVTRNGRPDGRVLTTSNSLEAARRLGQKGRR
ncbi:hypothetical protein OJF2_06910 [Aquisphaera giovannonii]|uniref:Uncharacterized protein n=1 Tax=Aquisphaera giovannonii TaxID=406548 RepID=A0A5B9VVF6_9BACT|nr:hypothetical protein OJF2_06910 [Aquisphaera giovannonii]